MKDRVPDGLGGNFSFDMKGHPVDGYFHYLLESNRIDNPESIISDYANEWHNYPTKENSYGVSGAEFTYRVDTDKNNNIVEGFEVDPTSVDNWNEYIIPLVNTPTGFYYTLIDYPGLTEYTLYDLLTTDGQYAKRPTTTRKTETQIIESSSVIDIRDKALPPASNLEPLNDKLTISFENGDNQNNAPDFEYYEIKSHNRTTSTRYWVPPSYVATNHEMKADTQKPKAPGSATVSTTLDIYLSESSAKDAAYTGIAGSGARPQAEEKAKTALNNLISTNYPGYTIVGEIEITETSVNYTTSSSGWLVKRWQATCDVTVEASATITKASNLTLYSQVSGTGKWSDPPEVSPESQGPTLNSDELRMYCGNSFTISCTDPDYEITKVKVHYSGGNLINRVLVPSSSTHARFVESSLIPAGEGVREIAFAEASLNFENLDQIQLKGMDYSADSDDGTGWHQWSGDGRSSITLELTDYHIQNGDWDNWTKSEYSYKTAGVDLNKYIIIDKIEVKCTKRTP